MSSDQQTGIQNKLSTGSGRDKLLSDMKSVIGEVEGWLKDVGSQTGDEFKHGKEKVVETLQNAKQELIRLEQTLVETSKDAARATDRYVNENPWKSVGIAAAVGVLCGVLLSRSRK
jgi:ElaB/YqjD/DUF883 family membrane-anchored ribosome-binding protein